MNRLVVVVLLNFNQNDYTLGCVQSILESNYEEFKLLVVDNGSSVENALKLEEKLPGDERIVFKKLVKNIGYGQGTNYGLKEGLNLNPEYFLIVNNDTIIHKDAIGELVKTCVDYENMARVTGKVYHFDQPELLQMVGYEYKSQKFLTFNRIGAEEKDLGQYDKVEERVMLDDVMVLQHVNLIKLTEGYSDYFWINGVNVDISLRSIEAGYKIIYTPKAKIWHKGSASIGGRNMNPKLAFWHIQSSLILRYLHLKRIVFIQFYIKTIFSSFKTMIKFMGLRMTKKTDNMDYALAKFKGIGYFNRWIIKRNRNSGYNPF